jgi:hypothetical protein
VAARRRLRHQGVLPRLRHRCRRLRAATVGRKILFVQALPAAIALALLFASA